MIVLLVISICNIIITARLINISYLYYTSTTLYRLIVIRMNQELSDRQIAKIFRYIT